MIPQYGAKPPKGDFKPRSGDPQAEEAGMRPVWLFGRVDHDGPFGWCHCASRDELAQIVSKLAERERMTWQELRAQGSHDVETNQFSQPARERLVDLDLEDVGSLFSIRLTGALRIWAVKDGLALSILWRDPEHQVAPSPKK